MQLSRAGSVLKKIAFVCPYFHIKFIEINEAQDTCVVKIMVRLKSFIKKKI